MSGGSASLSGSAAKQEHYHAFLSHDGADKSLVELIGEEPQRSVERGGTSRSD
jgi:hypothetical protein